MNLIDRDRMAEVAGDRLSLIAESFARLSGTAIVAATPTSIEEAMWFAPSAIVAHGTEADPLFFYANRMALELFEMPAASFIGLPSRLSTEPGERAERDAMLSQLERDDIVSNYA